LSYILWTLKRFEYEKDIHFLYQIYLLCDITYFKFDVDNNNKKSKGGIDRD